MITTGRTAAVTIVSLALGFVGGVGFLGSDVGLQFVPAPKLSAPVAAASPTKPTASAKPRALPDTEVKTPWPVKFRGGENGLMPETERTDLLPAPGCNWVIQPRPFQLNRPWVVTTPGRALFGNSEVEGPTDAFHSTLIQSVRQDAATLDLRPVFFDEEGTRYVPTSTGRGHSSSSDGDLHNIYARRTFTFRWPEQPPSETLVYFGIEQVAANAEQLLAAAAQKAAKDKGMVILPTPQIGKPYNFDLTTVDGKRLRAEDFRGKEVLIGVCGPKMSSGSLTMFLKAIRKANNDHKILFVGVSFEESVEKARATFAGSEPADSLIVVPNDAKTRRIWREGAQIEWLPTFFLLDKNGNLQDAGHSSQVVQSLNVRFGRTPFGTPKPKVPGPANKGPQPQPGGPPRP